MTRWIAAVSGYSNGQIFQSAPNAKAPSGDYISFRLLTSTADRFSHAKREEEDNGEFVRTTRSRLHELTFSIDVYSTTGEEVFERMMEAPFNATAQAALGDSGLCFMRVGTTRDLQFMNGPNYTPRWQADVMFRVMRDVVDRVETVDEIIITGEISEN
jgi:hypothetical protein